MPFQKGVPQTHVRKGGRRLGFRGIARLIAEKTKDGQELVDYALRVFRNEGDAYYHGDRWEALVWLANRGFGMPMQTIELDAALSVDVEVGPKIDVLALLKHMSPAARLQFRDALLAAGGRRRDEPAPPPTNVLQLVDGGEDDE